MTSVSLFSLPRLLSAFAFRSSRSRHDPIRRASLAAVAVRTLLQDRFAAELSPGDEVDRLVCDLLQHGRVALLLRPQLAASIQPKHLRQAQEVLDETMSLVPEGDVVLHSRWLETGHQETSAGRTRLHVESMFLDRYAVTNRDYQHFVDAGGYQQTELWEAAIWPAMGEMVDQTHQPGPRYWSNGRFAAELAEHPVVGVSWYEASAYARWIGKRLPSDAEWVKAGAWPVGTGGMPQQRRYPWGDVFDRSLANVWGSRANATVPVDEYPAGTSVGGIYQLAGNVWEWTSTPWGAWEPPSKKAETTVPMRSLRGGAFDTYFDSQAACQFQSGDDPLARRHNVGFRCALSWQDVAPQTSESSHEPQCPSE
jgi:iron(II)-dependent oxidoreductase